MSNPTSNFGWQMPTNTDLVSQLPADFEVFGQAVDTSLADLRGGTSGQVLKKNTNTDMDFVWAADSAGMTNPMTTTGDTIYSSSGSTPARLGIGTTGQILTVAGGVPTWATAAAPDSYTTIVATTSIGSVNSVTISSIAGTYKNLILVLSAISTTANATVYIEPNPTPRGAQAWVNVQGNAGYLATQNEGSWNATSRLDSGGTSDTSVVAEFPNYNVASAKVIKITSASRALDGNIARMSAGAWFNTATITALRFYTDNGTTFDSGDYALYGVK